MKFKVPVGIKKVLVKAEKNSPAILTGLGIAGGITTTILAVRATPKALNLIEEAEKEKARKWRKEHPDSTSDEPTLKLTAPEIIKATWKQYIPAIALGGASVACLIGANSVHTRRHAALYSAYKLSETALSEYKDKVEEVVSEKKMKEIKQKVAEEHVKKVTGDDQKAQIIIADDGDTWFVDAMSNQPFKSSKNAMDAAANKLNKAMRSEMYVSLSQLYDELGIPHTGVSDEIGWCIGGDEIDIELSDTIVIDNRVYIVMDFRVRPVYGFDKLY